jgi:hypothetical protein
VVADITECGYPERQCVPAQGVRERNGAETVAEDQLGCRHRGEAWQLGQPVDDQRLQDHDDQRVDREVHAKAAGGSPSFRIANAGVRRFWRRSAGELQPDERQDGRSATAVR